MVLGSLSLSDLELSSACSFTVRSRITVRMHPQRSLVSITKNSCSGDCGILLCKMHVTSTWERKLSISEHGRLAKKLHPQPFRAKSTSSNTACHTSMRRGLLYYYYFKLRIVITN